MRSESSQWLWAPGGATVRLPPRMCLAPSERARLWKGLERFVNCGDDLNDFLALGKAFPKFWPVALWHQPRAISHSIAEQDRETLNSVRSQPGRSLPLQASLNWHPVCHKLFLVYREILRHLWRGNEELQGTVEQLNFATAAAFLLGTEDLHGQAIDAAKLDSQADFRMLLLHPARPTQLVAAWQDILSQFPSAAAESGHRLETVWGSGEFCLVPRNDFQRGFYLLFRQCWRAKICSRCNMFFVARKPKQEFCGTGCSSGSRLASKLKWWKKTGTVRRATKMRAQRAARHKATGGKPVRRKRP